MKKVNKTFINVCQTSCYICSSCCAILLSIAPIVQKLAVINTVDMLQFLYMSNM